MTEVLSFMGDHPFLTWLLAWGIWPVGWAFTSPFYYAFKAYNRHLRAANIRAHGWPRNPLMDADGDIVHPPQAEKKNAS